MESAAGRVAEKELDSWQARHKAWGGDVRIADSQLGGVKVKTLGEAEVTVRIAWYRMDEQELHVTSLRQTYKDVNGNWRLAREVRADGDYGLLGDPVPRRVVEAEGAQSAKRAYFPSIHIGAEE